MNVKNSSILEFIEQNLAKHPRDINRVVSKQFNVSIQTANKYINELIKEGKATRVGKTRGSRYVLNTESRKIFYFSIDSNLKEDVVWKKNIKPSLSGLPENVIHICQWGLTEIFNNAIEHSEGSSVTAIVKFGNGNVELSVSDDGVGIFNKIKKTFKLASIREAIFHLSKGKVTTDPKKHTGLGIFFTSRMFDEFVILSSDMAYVRYGDGDWMMCKEQTAPERGTYVAMKIAIDSKRTTKEIFDSYSSTDETIGFHKTSVAVKLAKDEEESHISRSQARRLLLGLEKFREVVLDFKGVESVGQAFVDEIFRVFNNDFPEINIRYINANDDVEFMIKRSLENIGPNQPSFNL